MAIIGVVADDFTGTASAGTLMAKARVETGLFFDTEHIEELKEAERLQAIYVSTNSRALPKKEAYDRVWKASQTLAGTGVKYFSKKIDTTMRGCIGCEIDAMLDFMGEGTVAVVVTAMPASDRICIGGYSIIDGILLTETSVAQDVKTPVKEAYIPRLIQSQSKRKVGLVTIGDVEKGRMELAKCLSASRENGNEILVVDAMTMEHIRTIAEACIQLGWNFLAADPGPFTRELAVCRGIASECAEQETLKKEDWKEKPVLIIAGSANPSTRIQMEILCKESTQNKRIQISPQMLINGCEDMEAEVERAVKEAVLLLDASNPPGALLIETALHGSVVDLKAEDEKRGYQSGRCSELINQGLAMITGRLLEKYGQDRFAGLMLTGGDTMECVCRKIGASYIKAEDDIAPQADMGKIIGRYEGMPLAVKGGFCGYDEIVVDIVKRLHQM